MKRALLLVLLALATATPAAAFPRQNVCVSQQRLAADSNAVRALGYAATHARRRDRPTYRHRLRAAEARLRADLCR